MLWLLDTSNLIAQRIKMIINNIGKISHDMVCVVSKCLLVDNDIIVCDIDFVNSRHVSNGKKYFLELKKMKVGNHHVHIGNNTFCDVLRVDTIRINLPRKKNLLLIIMFYVPNLRRNLLFYIPPWWERLWIFRIKKVFMGKHGRMLVWGVKCDGSYHSINFFFSKFLTLRYLRIYIF